ncbi:unnamed protein product [Brugia pahangi]|uniref:GDP-fucose protein O-fucosyltransferase 1 n=1 Tax=Brugia pahangi TaxID=6280 RepID=A0A0N4TVM5_BRUPA|nr:unnamed protein product [Brugia pahangi]
MCLSLSLLFYFITLIWIGDFTSTAGYIVYCPCMGRFGNQMEHFLGMLAFAKALNRTLVLPPFVEYYHERKQAVNFDKYFLVKPLRNFHKMIVMREFIKKIAPDVWPLSERKAFCWQPRQSIYDRKKPSGCHAKEGNPFGPFWDYSNINFVDDVYYASDFSEAHFIDSVSVRKKWEERFPVGRYPVLSFISAPVAFPARTDHHHLQRYLRWSEPIVTEANKFIAESLEKPFIGIHLRNDIDWVIFFLNRFLSLFQIMMQYFINKTFSYTEKKFISVVFNSMQISFAIISEVLKLKVRSIFVSSDRNHYIDELKQGLKPITYSFQITIQRRYPENLHVNLAILSMADHFIGNCVSTLSAFIYRQRKYASSIPRPSSFFAQNYFIKNKDEL